MPLLAETAVHGAAMALLCHTLRLDSLTAMGAVVLAMVVSWAAEMGRASQGVVMWLLLTVAEPHFRPAVLSGALYPPAVPLEVRVIGLGCLLDVTAPADWHWLAAAVKAAALLATGWSTGTACLPPGLVLLSLKYLCGVAPLAGLSPTEHTLLRVGAALLACPGPLPWRVNQVVLLSAMGFCVACTVVCRACRPYPGAAGVALFVVYFGGLVHPYLTHEVLHGTDPAVWVLRRTLEGRGWALSLYWLACLAGFLGALQSPLQESVRSAIGLTNVRKLFHFLAVAMFAPGIVLEPEFMGLAFAVALAAMLLVECGRYNGLPAAPAVDRFMRRFTDERESGPGQIIRTHLYLLVGCAMPLWHVTRYASTGFLGGPPLVASCCGLIALGVTDAAASFVGVRYGRTKWQRALSPWGLRVLDGRKSVEGSVAAWLCTTACLLAVEAWTSSLSYEVSVRLSLAALLLCLLE
eukprot:EG_transcript_12292